MFSLANRSILRFCFGSLSLSNAQPAEQASLNYLSNLKGRPKTFEVILFAQVRAQRLSVFSLDPGEKTAIGDLDIAPTVVRKAAEFWLRVLLISGLG